MAKLVDYPAATRFGSDDILIKDGGGGTKKILVSNAAVELAGLVSPINRRNVFRGKNLGSSITQEQIAAIRAGTFDDLFIGDYWGISGVNWVIADMDYWLRCGDTDFNRHHLVIVPRLPLYSAVMNPTNTTEGGYVGSQMYTDNLEQAKTTISAVFGELLLTHREYLINAVTNGAPSGGAWFDSSVELMNEIMVYGSYVYTPSGNGQTMVNRYTVGNSQLSLFRLNPTAIKIRSNYWLRDVVSAAHFARVNPDGNANYAGASDSRGVRPAFPIG